MGADAAISLNYQLLPVADVEGSSWIVLKGGEPGSIPTRLDALQIKITLSLKLREKSAAVAALRVERGYTFANDPSVRQTRTLADAAAPAPSRCAIPTPTPSLGGCGSIPPSTGASRWPASPPSSFASC